MKCITPTVFKPAPNFTCHIPDCKFVAGVRPYRQETYKLGHEIVGTKFVVHNYGHGGAGITMSWGCADIVSGIVRDYANLHGIKDVAVIGYGVMGLTAAWLLAPHFNVTIYAERVKDTTSDKAGGQWAPSIVEFAHTNQGKKEFKAILETSFRMHKERLGPEWGVSERINYTKVKSATFAKVPTSIIPAPDCYTKLPIEGINSDGFGYHTLLVEPPIFLQHLRDDLWARGIRPVIRTIRTTSQIEALPQKVLVNCTGLGSAKLFNDCKMVPITGQLVMLPAQPALDYLYSTGDTYVFPRQDHVIVGGSKQENVDNEVPDNGICQIILEMARDVFVGKARGPHRTYNWLMGEK